MGAHTYTVRELVDEVAAAVDARFGGGVWVEGEVAEMSRSRNGHVYFDLVDRPDGGGAPEATIPVVLWASVRDRVNTHLRRAGSIRITDGVRIRVTGRIEMYAAKGRLQLVMQGIDPTYTLGLLASERDRVVQLLETEGLLHRNRSLPLPVVPLRVGLVTAGGSAAEADALQTFTDSGLGWQVVLVDARVQGAGAEIEVAAALRTAAAAGVDVIALVRGGGARTDLATFDHELVARTIAGLGVPVLTGIGHETDQSVADLVAHRGERTPTACAAALVAHVRAGEARAETAWRAIGGHAVAALHREDARVADTAHRVARATTGRLALEAHRLDAATATVVRRAPAVVGAADGRLSRAAGRAAAATRAHLRTHGHRLDRAAAALAAGAPRPLREAGRDLDVLQARVDAFDPRRALARGWSITRTADGTVVRDPAQVAVGDAVTTTVLGGALDSTVTATIASPSPAAPPEPTDPSPETSTDGR